MVMEELCKFIKFTNSAFLIVCEMNLKANCRAFSRSVRLPLACLNCCCDSRMKRGRVTMSVLMASLEFLLCSVDGAETVSYTHLDVYKRQSQG